MGCPLSPLAVNTVLQVTPWTIRHNQKEIKGTQILKEHIKLPVFADDMPLYTKHSKECPYSLLQPMHEFIKVV